MVPHFWPLLGILILLNLTSSVAAESADNDGSVPVIDAQADYRDAITDRMAFLTEPGARLSVGEVQALISGNPAILSRPQTRVLVNGIDSGAIWLVADVLNPSDTPIVRRVSVRTGWLEQVDFFLLVKGRPLEQRVGGDQIPLQERALAKRIPSADFSFPPGKSRLMLRIETADPMLVPLYFSSITTSHSREHFETAFYSFVYGAMFALSAYNLMLFAGLRKRRYLFYSLYMGSYVAMTASYSGIGMALLWPNAVAWQQWAPPLLMLCFASAGLTFATSFLHTKRHQPRLYRAIQICMGAYFTLFATCFVLDEQGLALSLVFLLAPVFSGLMLYMGVSSWLKGNQAARYFMLGTLASVIGASITALTVTGVITFSQLGYYAVDIGMVLDAMLLALALADLVRRNEQARMTAERNARIDPLTGLNNRRGFLPVAESLWSLITRKKRNICVAVIDIDHFKTINDQYGHAAGDRILQQIAGELDRSRRKGDLLARWGGEEFTLLLPETDQAEAYKVAERFRQNVERLVINDRGRVIRCTISIGVASRHAEHVTLDHAIATADHQLYQAKIRGRNQVCVGSTSDEPEKDSPSAETG